MVRCHKILRRLVSSEGFTVGIQSESPSHTTTFKPISRHHRQPGSTVAKTKAKTAVLIIIVSIQYCIINNRLVKY